MHEVQLRDEEGGLESGGEGEAWVCSGVLQGVELVRWVWEGLLLEMDGWMGLDRLRRRKGERERKEAGRRGLARRVESGVFELNLSVLQHPQRIKPKGMHCLERCVRTESSV